MKLDEKYFDTEVDPYALSETAIKKILKSSGKSAKHYDRNEISLTNEEWRHVIAETIDLALIEYHDALKALIKNNKL